MTHCSVLIATGLYPPEVGGPATYTRHLETSLPQHGVSVHVLPFRRVRAYPTIVRHIAYLVLLLREGSNADVIYAQDPVSVGLPAMIASFLMRKPFMLKVVGDYAWEQASQRFSYAGTPDSFQKDDLHIVARVLRAIERFVARRAHYVVVPSSYLGTLVAQWGVSKKKIIVIKNGIEPLDNTGSKQVIRGLLKYRGKLIVSVGRLVPWKGFELLIKSLPAIRKDFPDTKLLIIGSGPLMDTLEARARSMGLSNDVIFTGGLERDVVIRYIRAADVFALNTGYEGLSHQILEVMSVGVPVITTRVGGNPEVITHGVDGFLLRYNDAKGFRDTIKKVLSDAPLCTRIVQSAKKRVQDFSNERMVDETSVLLKKVCAS